MQRRSQQIFERLLDIHGSERQSPDRRYDHARVSVHDFARDAIANARVRPAVLAQHLQRQTCDCGIAVAGEGLHQIEHGVAQRLCPREQHAQMLDRVGNAPAVRGEPAIEERCDLVIISEHGKGEHLLERLLQLGGMIALQRIHHLPHVHLDRNHPVLGRGSGCARARQQFISWFVRHDRSPIANNLAAYF